MKRGYVPVSAVRKNLYKINEACKLLNTTARTLRYYEKLGLLPGTKRTRGQIRLYSSQEIAIFKKIKNLQSKGFKLSEVKDIY